MNYRLPLDLEALRARIRDGQSFTFLPFYGARLLATCSQSSIRRRPAATLHADPTSRLAAAEAGDVMTGRSVVLLATALSIAAIGATAGSKTALRYVWNVSGSVPTGLYRVRLVRDLTVTTLVAAYPPESLATWLAEGRYLARGVPLLKRILALERQRVCRIGPVITVDGRKVGAAREQDHSGRLLPVWQGCRVIGHGEVFLMNPDEPASLDGRYFGPIPLAAIAGLAEPIWTFAEGRSCGVDASPMPISGRDARTPTTQRQVSKCRLAFHVYASSRQDAELCGRVGRWLSAPKPRNHRSRHAPA
jgi:conjugative transfer signal peptidase TraF